MTSAERDSSKLRPLKIATVRNVSTSAADFADARGSSLYCSVHVHLQFERSISDQIFGKR
jgi:hypothetical protein